MRPFKFRAVITLDPAREVPVRLHPPVRQYLNHTHTLMIEASPLRYGGPTRHFPAEICWDDDGPLHPGDHATVTVTVTDSDAGAFFDAGQRFTLWSGGTVGHGTIARRVFSDYSPS